MDILIKKPSWKEARKASRSIGLHNQVNSNMLDRTARDIKKTDFWIARNFCGNLLGSVGIINWNDEGIEITSHLVLEKFRGFGVGKKLLSKAIEEAIKINCQKIFIFTTQVEYYRKLGFKLTDSKRFSQKILGECASCKNGPQGPGTSPCPEIALELNFSKLENINFQKASFSIKNNASIIH